MKKNFVKIFGVALVAATSFQTVAAQLQVANNRRERILQVLDQSRPNEYVPAAFFLHFENKLGNPDLVVLFTNTCSHKMAHTVDRRAEKQSFRVAKIHNASANALKSVLRQYCISS